MDHPIQTLPKLKKKLSPLALLSGAIALAVVSVSAAQAQAQSPSPRQKAAPAKPIAEESALEKYRDMKDGERAELAREAAADAASGQRAASEFERQMMRETPAEARAALARGNKNAEIATAAKSTSAKSADAAAPSASTAQRGTTMDANREFRVGNGVGKVVGTAFLTSRKIVRTADGLHLETCASGAHQHDAKTQTLLTSAAREAKKGALHE